MKHLPTTFVFGSVGKDLSVFFLVLACIVSTLSRLEVYYRAAPYKVSLQIISADGTSHDVAIPPEMEGTHRKQHLLKKIHNFSNSSKATDITPTGGTMEWTLHYSKNSLRFDQRRIITTTPASYQ